MARQDANQVNMPAYLQYWWAGLITVIIFLVISYGFVSWAINSGSLWQYVLAIVFFVWAVKVFVRAVRRIFNR
ncbi:MAG: hypothetical protein ABSD10_03610 [Candidatus Saccharimonadales bacterium]|jgi:uncharacterized membrane protein YccF (DUF307 family)